MTTEELIERYRIEVTFHPPGPLWPSPNPRLVWAKAPVNITAGGHTHTLSTCGYSEAESVREAVLMAAKAAGYTPMIRARFIGGPLHGQEREIPEDMDRYSVSGERTPGQIESDHVARTYKRDAWPATSGCVYYRYQEDDHA